MEPRFPRSEKRGIVDELHKPARRNYARRHVTIKSLLDLFQADIVDLQSHATLNKGFKYLLTVIDTFSKKGWAIPLKTKGGQEVSAALKSVFEKLNHGPKFLQTDHGTEFYNSAVAKVLKEFKTEHYSSFSVLKASIVERFNRTLKSWMFKEFSYRGSYEWLSFIDELVKRYNARIHRSIGLAPRDVNKSNEQFVLNKLQSIKLAPKKKQKFQIGDSVRISKFKHVFEKSYTPSWSTEVFIIDKVEKTVPITYKLRDLNGTEIKGGFYTEELLKTRYKNTYLVERVLKKKASYCLSSGLDSIANLISGSKRKT